MTLPIITSDDDVAAATPVAAASPAVNLRAGTDRITLLSIDPTFTIVSLPANAITPSGSNISITPAQLAQSNFQLGEIYFINSQYGATFGSVTNVSTGTNPNLVFGNSDVYGLNAPGNSGPIRFVSRGPNNQPVPTTLMRMRIIQYFVDANGLLVRRTFGTRGSGFIDSVIGEHVMNLQFRYIMNNFQQPVSHLSTAQQQVAVRQVEAAVVAETVHPVINGARQQLTATTVTSVRNLQFRQAL